MSAVTGNTTTILRWRIGRLPYREEPGPGGYLCSAGVASYPTWIALTCGQVKPGEHEDWVEPFRNRLVRRAAAGLREQTGRLAVARRARRKLRDLVARSSPPNWLRTRDDLAFRYLRGDGIEIGALYWPLRVPGAARIRYVDHTGGDELRRLYPEPAELVAPDVVDEAEHLSKFEDES